MAHQVKANDYTPDNLGLVPRTQRISRELSVVICPLSFDFHTYTMTCVVP